MVLVIVVGYFIIICLLIVELMMFCDIFYDEYFCFWLFLGNRESGKYCFILNELFKLWLYLKFLLVCDCREIYNLSYIIFIVNLLCVIVFFVNNFFSILEFLI